MQNVTLLTVLKTGAQYVTWVTMPHAAQAITPLCFWTPSYQPITNADQSAELARHLYARHLYARQQTFAATDPTQTSAAILQHHGWRLYRDLPDDIRAALDQLDAPLLIAANDFDLPWELLHDGAQFLALAHPIGRQLLTPHAPYAPALPPLRKDWQMLLIANPTGDLASTVDEVEQLADLVERIPGTRPPHVLANRRATRGAVLEALSSGDYDVIHYAGHAFFDRDAAGGLLLAHDEALTIADIHKYLRGRPFVFLNACESAKGRAAETPLSQQPAPGTAVQGLAAAFLTSGARAFIGALWRIRNDNAPAFAGHFYRQALQGARVGEALRQARKTAYAEVPNDPIWAAFVLYGDPRLPIFHTTQASTRPVTVLSARITDSAVLYNAWDMSSAADFIGQILRDMCRRIMAYHGEIISVAHDTVVAVFGASAVQEEHAKLALHAALDMRTALPYRPAPGLALLPGGLNIGIDTGRVRVHTSGDEPHRPLVLGPLIELARCLCEEAGAGQILVGAQTYEETQATFDFAPRAAQKDRVYEVIQIKPRRQQVLSLTRAKTPLLGRTAELTALNKAWEHCQARHKHSVMMIGEAGTGKSRLLHEFVQSVNSEGPLWLLGICHAHLQDTPLSCLAQLVADLFSIAPSDTPPAVERKLQAFLLHWGIAERELTEPVAIFREVLGEQLAVTGIEQDPQVWRGHLIYYLKGILTYVAQTRPVIVIVEDAHWMDSASRETLTRVFDELSDAPILLIAAQRPGKASGWENAPYNQTIMLGELDKEHCEALLCHLLDIDTVPEELRPILEKTKGNPFFLEEMIAALQEAEGDKQRLDGLITQLTIPPSIHSVVLERVNRLSYREMEVLQVAAVIGPAFPYTMLAALTATTEPTLDASLNELKQRGLIEDRSTLLASKRLRQYVFRHTLIHDVIYTNLSSIERQRHHRRMAQRIETLGETAFEELYAEQRAGYIEALAYHAFRSVAQFHKGEWRVGALTPEDYHSTITPLLDAATKAMQHYAHQEALTFYRQALLTTAAFSGDTRLQAAQCHAGLGEALHLCGEFAAAEEHLRQAYELWVDIGDDETRCKAAHIAERIGRIYERRGGKDNLAIALSWRDKGIALLPATPTPEAARLYALGGMVHFRNNAFTQAIQQLEHTLDLARQAQTKSELRLAHSMLSMVYHASGQLGVAMQHCKVSIELDQELGDAIGLAKDYSNQGVFAFEMDDWQLAKSSYRNAVQLLERVGDQYQWAITLCNLADMDCHLGEFEEGIRYAQRGLEKFTTLCSYQGMVFAHTILATLYWRMGNLDAAQAHIMTARELETTHNVAMFRSTVGRWLAQIHLTRGNIAPARSDIQELLTLHTDILADEVEPIQHLHAQILAAEGDVPAAIHILETSLVRLEEQRMRYQTGQALLALARLLTQIPHRATEARAYARRAFDIFVALGAAWDAREAEKIIRSNHNENQH